MKNRKFELYGRLQRQYHRHHPWILRAGGLFVPHCYKDVEADRLSWWDDVGFILNGRRVIVWWQHPRCVYGDAIDDCAWAEVGPSPRDDRLTEGSTKNYRRVGRSRKKVVSYTCRKPSEAQAQFYDRLSAVETRLRAEGIDHDVAPRWSRERLSWAQGVELIAPLEVRNARELAQVAALARRLLRGETTLAAEFPGYVYGRADWLRDKARLSASE